MICRLLIAAPVVFIALCLGQPPAAASDENQPAKQVPATSAAVQYNRDIRPILNDNCFACHGPDSASREAGLRLDVRDEAIDMMAIVPGDPDSSEMIDRIHRGADDDMAMPPIDGHKRLSDEQKQLLVHWVQEGAEYQPHWSLVAPTRPELPAVSDPAWVRNEIDRFVLARLDSAGLQPAEEADRRTLARRLSLDLTGLPPRPEEVEAFVNDTSPDYYRRYVDRLLESVRWGEHRARYWLDYARYADTHGIHFDNYREIWSYRDWVINAFNRNQPFDEFSIEQLAGDLLPEPTLDQQVATGFNRCNITTNEGGVIQEEYKVLYARDRTETTSLVWMGMTTGCAVCHDHKFDPISQKDFYSLSAFFNNTTQPVMDGNVPDTPPIITVPAVADRERFAALPAELAAARERVQAARDSARESFDSRAGAIDATAIAASLPVDQLTLHAALSGAEEGAESLGALAASAGSGALKWEPGYTASNALAITEEATLEAAEVGDFERDSAFSVSAWVWLPSDNTGGSIVARMDESNGHRGWDVWLENNRLASHLINCWPENALKVAARTPLPKQQWSHVSVTYDGSARPEGLRLFVNGREQSDRDVTADTLSDTIRTEVPLKVGSRHNSGRVNGMRINDLRIYQRALDAVEVGRVQAASRAAYLADRGTAALDDAEREQLFQWWLTEHAPEYDAAVAAERALSGEMEAIRARGTIAHVMAERDAEPEAFVLARGEYDQRGERVTADVPKSLPAMDPSQPKNRLGLARWLFSEEHPLTARVTVNRFWQEVFGVGLVETSGDFGTTGTLPSHPELLDWLAVEFRESGWDVKELFRTIVMSASYRQAAVATPEKLEIDPQNRLLSRGPRFRMDAEMVRDYALAASELLSAKIGGPSVRPYQPQGVWEAVAMPGSNTRDYVRDSGAALYRRSMYTFWKRSAPPASMDIMNAPSREGCTVRRERTNTPLQALVTLNDPQSIEAARHLAALAIGQSSESEVRIQAIAQRLLARPLTEPELAIVSDSLGTFIEHYRAHPEDAAALIAVGETEAPEAIDPSELAAWTMLCNQMMNLDEVLNK